MLKRIVQMSLALLFFFFSLVPQSLCSEPQRYEIAVGESQQRGPTDAPVTLIEFLDFQ
jgi:hypothetical protein